MALPDGVLSSETIDAPFIGGRALPVRDIVDYETGGIGIQDTSEGLMYQTWRARILNNKTDIVVDAENVPATTLISGTNITEVSLSFDQNMRPVIAYVENGTPKLYWYDSTIPGQTTTDYPGIITPRVSLDDKRELQSQISDVIFAYIRFHEGRNRLFYRQQRDRYTIEYDPLEGLPGPIQFDYRNMIDASGALIKIGMNRQMRMQFMFRTPT